jgi:flagellar basal-body rod protein FlgB
MSGDSGFTLLDQLTSRLDWLSARQRVISQNVANADTPKYVPRDIVQKDFAKVLRQTSGSSAAGGLATTSEHHLASTQLASDPREQKVDGYETTPTGNSVVLEEQMTKLADTQIDYQTITNLYRKHLSMIRLALGART